MSGEGGSSDDEAVVEQNPGGSASEDPDTFTEQINTAIDDLAEKIEQYLEKMADAAEDSIKLLGFAGPLGALAAHELGKKFEDSADEVSAAWEEKAPLLREAISAMIGDPLAMGHIAASYRDAADAAGEATNSIGDGNALLGTHSFDGRAKAAYTRVSTVQEKAVAGFQTQLLKAADIMDDNQASLLLYWNRQLWNLLNAIDDFYEIAGDLGDLANAPTFEAGPAVKLIGEIIGTAGTILKDYGDYLINLNVVSAGDWDGLNSSFGKEGLPGDRWPRIDEAQRGALNEPWV